MISRCKPLRYGLSPSSRSAAVCQGLAFSYGVHPMHVDRQPEIWWDFIRSWIREHHVPGTLAMLAAGPSTRNPAENHRLEFLRVGPDDAAR